MFGYQVILEVGGKKYDIVESNFSFMQSADGRGKPEGDVYSGAINMTFPNTPSDEMLEWMLNTRKYNDGTITLFGEDGKKMQELSFKQATCINMKIEYENSGSSYCSTNFTIVANKLQFGEAQVDNAWPIFNA